MKPNAALEFAGLGLYKSLTFIGIGIGILLLMRGLSGKTLGPIVLVLLGIFIAVKELMDIMHYTSTLNVVGVGVGAVVIALGIMGVHLPAFALFLLGVFMAAKEVMDLMHSG